MCGHSYFTAVVLRLEPQLVDALYQKHIHITNNIITDIIAVPTNTCFDCDDGLTNCQFALFDTICSALMFYELVN